MNETLSLILIVLVLILLVLGFMNYRLQKKSLQSNEDNPFGQKFEQMRDDQERMERRLQESTDRLKSNISDNNEKVLERYNQFERTIQESLTNYGDRMNQQLEKSFQTLTNGVEENLSKINDKVNERLDQSFNKTNETFHNILERLSKIDEAQKNIESLSTDIVSLQSILTDKKARGTYGEVQLYQILASIFGEEKDGKTYKTQCSLSNGTIVDALLFAPEPLGKLSIDSKFPLENYQRMTDRNLPESERVEAEKQFKKDMQKHIDTIAKKYIIPGETSDQAIMFLPAEAIFAELHSYHYDIIEKAQQKRVWITSPTTLIATLTTMQVILNQIEREKNAELIQKELVELEKEFNRYRKRWDDLSKHMDTVSKDVKDIHTTTNKISKRFEKVSNAEIGLSLDESE